MVISYIYIIISFWKIILIRKIFCGVSEACVSSQEKGPSQAGIIQVRSGRSSRLPAGSIRAKFGHTLSADDWCYWECQDVMPPSWDQNVVGTAL